MHSVIFKSEYSQKQFTRAKKTNKIQNTNKFDSNKLIDKGKVNIRA